MHKIAITLFCFCLAVSAQVPLATRVEIVKAEDARTYNAALEKLIASHDAKVRTRAALAAGRIGDEKAVPALAALLEKDTATDVRAMAAFALGEIESLTGAEAILKALGDEKTPDDVRARAVEAAGKIVGANAVKGKNEKVEDLGEAILDTLNAQDKLGAKQSREVVLAGLTAALRGHARTTTPGLSKEEVEAIETGFVVAKFLTNLDARVRADAANTISRARYKKANQALRSMLLSETDPVARANAARALGSAEDKEAFGLLLEAAAEDDDSRVRVSAIRSLGALKDAKAADKLLERGEKLLGAFKPGKNVNNPAEKNELLEIATVLGRLLPKTNNEKAVKFLRELSGWSLYRDPETAIAFARIAPAVYFDSLNNAADNFFGEDWRAASAAFQALGEIGGFEKSAETDEVKLKARLLIVKAIGSWVNRPPSQKAAGKLSLAVPDMLRAFGAFKSENTSNILRPLLEIEQDLFIRAVVAEVMADQPASKENVEALKGAFTIALLTDKTYNDAQLGILDALWKLDKKESVGTLLVALSAPDHLVRKRAIDLLGDKDLQKDFPGIPTSLANAREKGKDRPQLYSAAFLTKLGSILNTNADYTRAVSRKNGTVRAVLTTEMGTFTIELLPEDAPLTVDNFIKLARTGYFNGVMVHRVVPNFVMQDGDPRGDGNGGPGWSIRCEVNMVQYDRGAVGMALSGKDTGGSQWFVTHSPQPHLDGGYTVFGHVDDAGMKVVDKIARGDKIISVRIVEVANKTAKRSEKR
jgi:cyclophilin family peptidyl-prolyl cis-trans isomerase/HEAT repeat protein